jgi:hypothetical protein
VVMANLTAVRYDFKVNLAAYTAFDGEVMTMARERCRLLKNQEGVDAKGGRQPEILPLLLDQLDWLRQRLWLSEDSTVESKMAYLAIACSYNIVLRVGEVASVGPYVSREGAVLKMDHRFYLRDIEFEDSEGTRYNYEEYRKRPRAVNINFMIWTTPSSKSSKQGPDGTKYFFNREGSPREKLFFEDVVMGLDLFNVPSMEYPVFSRFKNGQVLQLTSKVFAEHLKVMATHFGIDPKHLAGKSTRKGGAQNMAVSGRSDSEVARLTNHASIRTTMKHYVKDVGTFGNVFANPDESKVSVESLRRTLPRDSLIQKNAGLGGHC